MTTNKPGSVNQGPLYGCTNCYEDWTLPADDLRVHDSECWCDSCWDQRQEDFPDQPGWSDLEPYTPALQADYQRLQAECDRLTSYYKNGIDCFANPCEMHSGERTPTFAEFFEKYGGQCLICMVDDNKALQDECEKLRKDAEFLAIRLANVASLVGYPMPEATPEQISEIAGAILGSIAGILRKKQREEAGVSALVEALEEISDPIRFMQERLEEGESLNGMAAVQLAKDASYLRGIAIAALAAYRSQGGDA